ncbi:MAG: PorV/PorQ family protein [Candidatus Margulisiibacteriota bacterium]
MKNKILGFSICIMMVVLCLPAFSADNLVVADPMYIGVGARSLGMGKAYVALAEDGDGIFMNPAGLGKVDGPKVTSMYTNLIGDVNYVVLGGAYPHTKNSAIGAGAVVSNVSGIGLYDSLGNSKGVGSWGSSVMFLSYGMNVEDAHMQFGGSVKYYNQGGGGSATVEAASASGVGMDVGAIYSPSDSLSLGINAQNPLGANLESGNSVENTLLPLVKAGAKVTLRPTDTQKINLLADADIAKRRSTTMHFGAEYYPVPNIALRAGVDQDPVAGGVESNLTAGVGLRFSGIQFDYAYHPYSSIADNTTHYFSVSYVGPEKKTDEASDLELSILKPADKSVIYADNVEVSGTVKGNKLAFPVKINGVNAPIDPNGNFTLTVPVDKVGKKLIVVEAQDFGGKTILKDSRKILRLLSFSDVGEGYWAKKPIEHSSTVGLVQGYPDGKFKPDRALTRAELATLLVRSKGVNLPGYARQVFKDVKTSYWAANYIEAATRMGLVKGYPDGKFRPNNRISKAEAIAVLVRFDGMVAQVPDAKPYGDVSTRHWAARYIAAAKDSGMLNYIEGPRLRPKEEVNRAEAVEMLAKTNMAAKLINDLLSWDKGFEYEISRPTLKASL